MGRNENIYGADDNSFAEGIASTALGIPDSNRYSGSPEQDDALSAGSKGKKLDGTDEKTPIDKEPNPQYRVLSNKSDSRASTKGNHGAQG